MAGPIKPRSQSVFQNYQNFQAWEQLPDSSHYNLLQRLNKNLSSYENKYKKYMNIRENEMRQMGKLQSCEEEEQKDIQEKGSFLPSIKMDYNFVRHSQNFPKPKILVEQQSNIKDEEIFCERSNNNLKLKTISFDKNSKTRIPAERRKYSLNQNKHNQVERFFHKHQHDKCHQKQNTPAIETSPLYKIDTSNKMQGYKQLRSRLKKAANKSKMPIEPKPEKVKQRDLKENIPLRKVHHKRLSSVIRDIEDECLNTKTNEFSDKKFYEQNIKQKSKLQR